MEKNTGQGKPWVNFPHLKCHNLPPSGFAEENLTWLFNLSMLVLLLSIYQQRLRHSFTLWPQKSSSKIKLIKSRIKHYNFMTNVFGMTCLPWSFCYYKYV